MIDDCIALHKQHLLLRSNPKNTTKIEARSDENFSQSNCQSIKANNHIIHNEGGAGKSESDQTLTHSDRVENDVATPGASFDEYHEQSPTVLEVDNTLLVLKNGN